MGSIPMSSPKAIAERLQANKLLGDLRGSRSTTAEMPTDLDTRLAYASKSRLVTESPSQVWADCNWLHETVSQTAPST